jgi:CRISPR-associated protein Csd1
MLLRQLVDFTPILADDATPARPYSRQRSVRWELNLTKEGRIHGQLVGLSDPDRPSKAGQDRLVPNAGRTVAIAPSLGADDVQYVLGWADETSKPTRVADAHAAFVALCRRWAQRYPQDPVAAAVVAFYDRGEVAKLDESKRRLKWTSKDLVLVTVDGRPVTASDTLWQLWKTVVEERKSGGGAGGERRGLCLVCGGVGVLLNRMPQALPKALVPRAEQEVALVSANKPIHTYDFSEGLGTAPICVDCGQAAVANMRTVLEDDLHTFSFPRQRTRLAWWITHGGDESTIALLNDRPSRIADYLNSVKTGTRQRMIDDDHHLCSVTVSGNVARLVVHDWINMPLPVAEQSIERWFDDQKVVHRWRDGHAGFPVWLLVTCAGQWLPGAGQRGRYIPLFDKAADRPDDLAHLLVRSALHGAALPPHVLAHIVRRIRTDVHLDEARIALLRVAMIRQHTSTVETPMAGLDPTNTNPAYVCGRLFAVLEATQRAAYRRDQEPNTTFFDRYFAGAVANPRVAIVQGSQLSAAWLKRIRGSGERDTDNGSGNKRLGAYYALKNRLDELHQMLAVQPLPARITTAEQSLFIIGYHHQRADDLARARAGRAPEIVADQPEPTDSTDEQPKA